MSNNIPDKVAEVLRECELGKEAVWQHKQSGSWIVKHWALERAAAHKCIKFDQPTVVCADPEKKLATLIVTGHLGDKTEWSFGEAAPYNTQQTYPFAMAEKRGKDRVILKLIGLHGLAYSEEEADDFKSSAPKQDVTPDKQEQKPAPSKPDTAEAYREKLPEDSRDYAFQWLENSGRSMDALKAAWGYIHNKYQSAPFYSELVERKDELKAQLTKEAA